MTMPRYKIADCCECGGKTRLEHFGNPGSTLRYWICCQNGHEQGENYKTGRMAVNMWNRRMREMRERERNAEI